MTGPYEMFGRMERQGWTGNPLVENYVALFVSAAEQAIGPLLAAAQLHHGMRALDLCCGQGSVAKELLAHGCVVTGLDFSQAMLALARSRLREAEFLEGDAQALPFPDGQFDRVLSNFGICHVPDQPLALAEAHRVLRPGGWLGLTVWCGPDRSPCFELLYRTLATHGDPSVRLPPGPDFHQFADPAMARCLLYAAGFQDVQWRMVDCALKFDQPEGLCDIFEKATARASQLLVSQPPGHLAAIRSAMASEVQQRFQAEGGWRVPMPAALVCARA